MTTRTDVTVDFDPSPRVAEIASPSTTLNMQDIVDTLRKQEDTFAGISNPKLTDAAGKEALGGALSVGITVSLQNTRIAFESRTTPAETGTVTTGSAAPVRNTISFQDSAADFVTANVARGSLVINFSDRSIADVIRVDNANQLTTKVLANGTTNTFQIGDVYHVFNVVRCTIDGGNLVAVDDVGGDLDPVQPTAFTQVVRTLSSSATIVESDTPVQPADFVTELRTALFDGVSFENVMIRLLAWGCGKFVQTGTNPDTFTYYHNDEVTPMFVLTLTEDANDLVTRIRT